MRMGATAEAIAQVNSLQKVSITGIFYESPLLSLERKEGKKVGFRQRQPPGSRLNREVG